MYLTKSFLTKYSFRRIREKYETELKEVEKSERKTLEKFNTMKVHVHLHVALYNN